VQVRSLLAFAALMLLPAGAGAASPNCWQLAGDDPSCYHLDRDSVVTYGGKPSGRLMSVGECQSFGTMVQCIDPADYAGKRIRFSAYVKARDVRDWAGLWMRVDGEGGCGTTLAFDNMSARPIKGSRDWARYEIVLNVGKEAKNICLGLLLQGKGNVWLSGVSFEAVSTAVPVTVADGRMEQKPATLNSEP
jgi:hypothetical protein